MSSAKKIMDMRVTATDSAHPLYTLLTLTPADGATLPVMEPGQFVQIAVPAAPHTFLRRPISINGVDSDANTLSLLIRRAGEGTARLCDLRPGDSLNILLPLGRSFTIPDTPRRRLILAGGGVGIAPLCFLGTRLRALGMEPEFIVGARSASDLLQIDTLRALGTVHVTTDDGSAGEHGLITAHSAWRSGGAIDRVYCCGPAPMMKAVARLAASIGAGCEVSLENMMACGLGACLCCVEKTVRGNVCVCTEGPVFNIKDLTWLD